MCTGPLDQPQSAFTHHLTPRVPGLSTFWVWTILVPRGSRLIWGLRATWYADPRPPPGCLMEGAGLPLKAEARSLWVVNRKFGYFFRPSHSIGGLSISAVILKRSGLGPRSFDWILGSEIVPLGQAACGRRGAMDAGYVRQVVRKPWL